MMLSCIETPHSNEGKEPVVVATHQNPDSGISVVSEKVGQLSIDEQSPLVDYADDSYISYATTDEEDIEEILPYHEVNIALHKKNFIGTKRSRSFNMVDLSPKKNSSSHYQRRNGKNKTIRKILLREFKNKPHSDTRVPNLDHECIKVALWWRNFMENLNIDYVRTNFNTIFDTRILKAAEEFYEEPIFYPYLSEEDFTNLEEIIPKATKIMNSLFLACSTLSHPFKLMAMTCDAVLYLATFNVNYSIEHEDVDLALAVRQEKMNWLDASIYTLKISTGYDTSEPQSNLGVTDHMSRLTGTINGLIHDAALSPVEEFKSEFIVESPMDDPRFKYYPCPDPNHYNRLRYAMWLHKPYLQCPHLSGVNDPIDFTATDSECSTDTEDIPTMTAVKGMYKEYRKGKVDETIVRVNKIIIDTKHSVEELNDTIKSEAFSKNVSDIKDVLSNYKTADLKDFAESLEHSINKASSLIDKLPVEDVSKIKDYLENILKTTSTSDKEGFKDDPKSTSTNKYLMYLTLIAFTGCATMAVREKNIIYIVLSIVLGGVLLWYFDVTGLISQYQHMKSCLDYIGWLINSFSTWGESKPQMLDSDIDQACGSIGTLFSFYLLKDTPYHKMAGEIYSKVSNWERFSGNLTAVIKNVVDMINKIYNYVIEYASAKDEPAKYQRWLKSSNPEIEDFVSESQDFCDRFYAHKLHYTEVNHDKLKALIRKGHALLLSLHKGKVGTAPTVINQIFHQLLKMNEKFSKYDWESMGTRPEPVWLLFLGAAGNGKSIVSRKLTHYIIGHLLPDDTARELFIENTDQYIYYHKAGNEYYEGYLKSTIATVQDDWNQTPDVVGGKTSEPLTTIHMVNTEPMILNMAFGDKGHMPFNSKLIVGSGNTLKPKFETITHSQAYWRRCKNAYICVPKPHLRIDGTLIGPADDLMQIKVNKELLPLDDEGDSVLDETCVDFVRVHYSDDGKVTYGNVVDYHQVVKDTLVSLRQNEMRHQKHSKDLKKERLRGVKDYYEAQGLMKAEEKKDTSIPHSNFEFNYETAAIEDYIDYWSNPDPTDRTEKKKSIDFDQIDIDRMTEFTKKCKDLSNVRHAGFYMIALHFYRKWNDWSVSSNVDIEEVFVSYYTRFGDEFWDLFDRLDMKGMEDLGVYIVRNQPKFDRKHSNVIRPWAPLAKWHQIKTFLRNWRQHLYDSHIKGSWVETITQACAWAYEQNPYYFKFMGVIFLLNVVSSMYNKYVGLPSLQKLVDKEEERIEVTKKADVEEELLHRKMKDHIALEQEWIDELNDAIRVKLKDVSSYQSKFLIDDLVKTILQDDDEDQESMNAEKKLFMIRTIYDQMDVQTTAQSSGKVVLRTKKRGKKLKLKNQKPLVGMGTSESQGNYGIDSNGDEILRSLVNNNCYELLVRNSPVIDVHTRIGTMTFMKYRYAHVLKHFISHFIKNMMVWDDAGLDYLEEIVILRSCGEHSKVVHKCKMKDFMDIRITDDEVSMPYVSVPETVDGVILKVNISSLNMGPRRDILSYFATKSQYMSLPNNCPGAIVMPGHDKDVIMPVANVVTHSSYVNIYSDSLGNKYQPHYLIEYKAKTVVGSCGSLVAFDRRNLGAVRVFGFHTSGATEKHVGFSEAVFRENIEAAIAHFEDDNMVTLPLDTTKSQANVMVADGQFSSLYYLDKPISVCYETDLKPSKLSGIFFPPKEMPAKLKPFYVGNKRIDPWEHNLKKFPKESKIVDPKIIKEICDQMYVDLMQSSFNKVTPRDLTMEEACLGEDEYELGSMPRDTSPGYKYCISPVPGLPKSYRFFGKDPEGYNIDNEYYVQLEKDVEKFLDDLENGILDPEMYIVDNVKDECLPIEKVIRDYKSRLYNSFQMESKTAQKMLYGAFASWISKNRISNGIAIGVNPYAEWDDIAKHLLVFGDEFYKNIRAGDYSRFDMKQLLIIMFMIHEHVICRWYASCGVKSNKKRRNLFWTLICSQRMRIDLVYECTGGMPSGSFLTALLNSLYNKFNSMYVWYRYHNFAIIYLPEYKVHIRIIVLGDDILMSISPDYNDFITDTLISEYLDEIGMNYTLETKGEMKDNARCITEVEFLKRTFRRDPLSHRWIAPIRLECTLETLYWTRKRPEADNITRQNVDFVLKELALHGTKVFAQYAPIIGRASYDQLDYYSDFQNYFMAYEAVMNMDGYF